MFERKRSHGVGAVLPRVGVTGLLLLLLLISEIYMEKGVVIYEAGARWPGVVGGGHHRAISTMRIAAYDVRLASSATVKEVVFPFGRIFGPFWPIFGPFLAFWGHFGWF